MTTYNGAAIDSVAVFRPANTPVFSGGINAVSSGQATAVAAPFPMPGEHDDEDRLLQRLDDHAASGADGEQRPAECQHRALANTVGQPSADRGRYRHDEQERR